MRPVKGDSRQQFGHLGCDTPGHAAPKTEASHPYPGGIRKSLSLQVLPATLEICHELIRRDVSQGARHVVLTDSGATSLPRKQVHGKTHIARLGKSTGHILNVRRQPAVFMTH